MSNVPDTDAELERLQKARERIRQLRNKVKYLNDLVPGSSYGGPVDKTRDTPTPPERPSDQPASPPLTHK